MAGAELCRGFIVHPFIRRRAGDTEACLVGRLSDGHTFAVVLTGRRPAFWIRASDAEGAKTVLAQLGPPLTIDSSSSRTMDGEECLRISSETVSHQRRRADALQSAGIRTYEADVPMIHQVLMDLGVRGSVAIHGRPTEGRRVDRIWVDPIVEPDDGAPDLAVLSIDIETDPRATTVLAASIAGRGPLPANRVERCLVRHDRSETDLLTELAMLIREADPDIITGWNVVDFDLSVLATRYAALGIPFDIARSDAPARLLSRRRSGAQAVIEGRQVLDAMWLVRTSPDRYEDYRLETVARAILGKGKLLDRETHEGTPQAVLRLFETDPDALCRYCLEDARLVLDILDREGLITLTQNRSLLIGTSLERSWMSVASFEFLYCEHLHRMGVVGPTLGVDQPPMSGVAGGAIITPQSGFYESVLVFDFKSLYPTIMRTFNIDPLAHANASSDPRPITAPNDACFAREEGIMPRILQRFFESRAAARERGNSGASYAYKIIMNSFYGVLGTGRCRFASPHIAGAITSFGQHILHWTRDRISALGHAVIYGDTDSLFVLPAQSRRLDYSSPDVRRSTATQPDLVSLGRELSSLVNAELTRYVEDAYGLTSHLELEFEKIYHPFLLPPVRGSVTAPHAVIPRGRAKGYAGLLSFPEEHAGTIDVVGMEAVRYDWTDLARDLQREFLGMIFHLVPEQEIRARLCTVAASVRAGELDQALVYRKRLRKNIAAYTASQPPHVRAAALLPPEEQEGVIRYLWTVDGPQPESRTSAAIDYEHYIQRQMLPVLQGLSPAISIPADLLSSPNDQLSLF